MLQQRGVGYKPALSRFIAAAEGINQLHQGVIGEGQSFFLRQLIPAVPRHNSDLDNRSVGAEAVGGGIFTIQHLGVKFFSTVYLVAPLTQRKENGLVIYTNVNVWLYNCQLKTYP